MTPKEKAQELVLKYLGLQEPNYNWFNKTLAKQCALIAVDEMISYFSRESFMMAYPEIAISELQYWKEVKQEIEAL